MHLRGANIGKTTTLRMVSMGSVGQRTAVHTGEALLVFPLVVKLDVEFSRSV